MTRGDPEYRTLILEITPTPGGTILQGEFATSFFSLLVLTIVSAAFSEKLHAYSQSSLTKISRGDLLF